MCNSVSATDAGDRSQEHNHATEKQHQRVLQQTDRGASGLRGAASAHPRLSWWVLSRGVAFRNVIANSSPAREMDKAPFWL